MKKQAFWNIDNVLSFRGFDVVAGEISLSDAEYSEHLDEIHDTVEICGMSYSAGDALKSVDPTAFRCGKSDYESEIQSELEEQLSREDGSDIEFIDGDERELEDDEIMEKTFKIYWLDGTTSIISGTDIAHAFNKNYGGGAIRAVDWYWYEEVKD